MVRLGFEPTIPLFDLPWQILTMLLSLKCYLHKPNTINFYIICVKKRNTQFLHYQFLGQLSRLWFNVEKFRKMFIIQVVYISIWFMDCLLLNN